MTDVFGLSTVKAGGTKEHDLGTSGGESMLAVIAFSAIGIHQPSLEFLPKSMPHLPGHSKRRHYLISFFEVLDFRPDFFDGSSKLVALEHH